MYPPRLCKSAALFLLFASFAAATPASKLDVEIAKLLDGRDGSREVIETSMRSVGWTGAFERLVSAVERERHPKEKILKAYLTLKDVWADLDLKEAEKERSDALERLKKRLQAALSNS